MTTGRFASLLLTAALAFGAAAHAQDDLTRLDLETLMTMDVTITSAARHAQASGDAAAAVYVITREDIRRSGATSVPQLLRLVPGLHVARVSPRGWVVTSRGFGSRFATKLLVMVDGRSIYNALFSGVLWEEQPVPLDYIERIEIVRGPGGALWGVNAVNGVINIITRSAAQSQGAYAEAAGGSYERIASLGYGAQSDALGAWRAYASRHEIDAFENDGTPARRTQTGFRLDRPTLGGELSLQGDYAHHDFSEFDSAMDVVYAQRVETADVLVSWTATSAAGMFEIRSFYGQVDRSTPVGYDDARIGVETQYSAVRRGRHVLTFGAGAQRLSDEQQGGAASVQVTESRTEENHWSVYGQDELYFREDALRVTLGAKLEHFENIGFAFQPTLRTLWKLNDSQTLWAAASRALRSPSRLERHMRLETPLDIAPGLYYGLYGDPQVREEELRAYEFGWRFRPAERLSFDTALYYNDYTDLIALSPQAPLLDPGPPPRFFPLRHVYANVVSAATRGAEVTAEWQALERVRFAATGAWFDVQTPSDVEDIVLTSDAGRIDAKESYSLRARINLPRGIELDAAWRYVGALEGLMVDSYDALDVRAAWLATPNLELSLTIENALGGSHRENIEEISDALGARIKRSGLLRATWRPQPAR